MWSGLATHKLNNFVLVTLRQPSELVVAGVGGCFKVYEDGVHGCHEAEAKAAQGGTSPEGRRQSEIKACLLLPCLPSAEIFDLLNHAR